MFDHRDQIVSTWMVFHWTILCPVQGSQPANQAFCNQYNRQVSIYLKKTPTCSIVSELWWKQAHHVSGNKYIVHVAKCKDKFQSKRINSTISEKIKTQSQVVSIVCLYLFLPLGIQLLRVEGWNRINWLNLTKLMCMSQSRRPFH